MREGACAAKEWADEQRNQGVMCSMVEQQRKVVYTVQYISPKGKYNMIRLSMITLLMKKILDRFFSLSLDPFGLSLWWRGADVPVFQIERSTSSINLFSPESHRQIP